MAKPITYREQEKLENTVKLREFLTELPPYVKDYFRAKEPTTSDKTRLSYAYDLRVFFRFLQETNSGIPEGLSILRSETGNQFPYRNCQKNVLFTEFL